MRTALFTASVLAASALTVFPRAPCGANRLRQLPLRPHSAAAPAQGISLDRGEITSKSLDVGKTYKVPGFVVRNPGAVAATYVVDATHIEDGTATKFPDPT